MIDVGKYEHFFLERGAIFSMDTQVTPESIIGYVILISEVIWGHQRSTTVNWGQWGQNCKTTLRDAIFCMYTHMIPKNNVDYVYLTSKVNGDHQRWKLRGHWRSKIANWGHTLIKNTRDAFFYMYIRIVSIYIGYYKILTSKFIRGHWR